MSRFPMNPNDEQRLIQEVRYLHSLWHQGPPHPHPHPHHHSQTHPNHPTTPWSLQPSSSTKFKKRSRKKDSKWLSETDFQDSGIEWACKSPAESPPLTESGWPSFKPQPNKKSHLPTVEELAIVEANRVQQHALKAVSEYLKYSVDAEDDDEYDEDDEDVMEVEKGEKEKSLSFFAKLFEEDSGLREYYVKNSESGNGEFSCLVCCGVGKKGWNKRFKDCVALVQHSISIAKTNSRQAHRAYGQVICRVLGWDINRLGDKQSAEAQVLGSRIQTSSLVDSNDGSNKTLQGNDDGGKDGLSGPSNTTDTLNISNAELSPQKQSFSNENQQENGGGSTALERNSPVEASVSDGIPETAKENTEGVSDCLGNEGNDGKNNLSGQSSTTDTGTVGSNELSQQKEPFGNENKQQNAGGSMGLEGNEGNDGKNNLSGQSSTTDAGTVDSNELSQQKEPFGDENKQQNAGGSTGLEEPLPDDTIVAQKDDVSKDTTILSAT